MSRQNKILLGALAASVANNGTFVVSYPDNEAPESGPTDSGRFNLTMEHKLFISSNAYDFLTGFNLTFGAANITVKNVSGATWPAGAPYQLEIKERGDEVYGSDGKVASAKRADVLLINLGAPNTLSATAIAAAQAIAAAGNAVINGANAINGVAVNDVARGLSVVSSAAGDTTQTITIYGTDIYGKPLREAFSLNGTVTRNGLKAFKNVSRVQVSAALAGNLSVGVNDVIGLPVFLPSAAHVLREIQDNTIAAAGAFVAGLRAEGGSTATTGDVRGTYDPNAACDGSRAFELLVALPDPGYKGLPQFA